MLIKMSGMLTAVSLVGLVTGQACAISIDAGSPLVPAGLGDGDSFQLVFVTSTKTSPDSLDGSADGQDNTVSADWNTYVNAIADASSLAGIPDITWSAIVSIQDKSDGSVDPGVAANVNAPVIEDVYRTDGTLVAMSANFYTSDHAAAIKWNELGDEQATGGSFGANRLVWTGSSSTGEIDFRPLGNPASNTGNFGIRTGNAESTTDNWANTSDATRRSPDTSLRVYGLSEVITIGSGFAPGDTDGDGDIDDSDLGSSFANYTGPVGAAGNKTADQGDTDGDGDVDDSDLGTSFSGYTGPQSPAAVPEPTSLALLGLGSLLIARRRRA